MGVTLRMKTVLTMIAAFALAGCSSQSGPETDSEDTQAHVKISVLQSGKILMDGAESTVDEVEKRFVQLKSEKGRVWYYREAAQQDPPAGGDANSQTCC